MHNSSSKMIDRGKDMSKRVRFLVVLDTVSLKVVELSIKINRQQNFSTLRRLKCFFSFSVFSMHPMKDFWSELDRCATFRTLLSDTSFPTSVFSPRNCHAAEFRFRFYLLKVTELLHTQTSNLLCSGFQPDS